MLIIFESHPDLPVTNIKNFEKGLDLGLGVLLPFELRQ